MKAKAGLIGVMVWGMAWCAQAYVYSGMAVAGTHNVWNTTPNMSKLSGSSNVWVCTQVFNNAEGLFKFTANGAWDVNWGGNATRFYRVPAAAVAPTRGGPDLGYSGLTQGLYRITFNETTTAFTVDWAGAAPLPAPSLSSVALIGDFNNWVANANSALVQQAVPNAHLWKVSLNLGRMTEIQFQVNGGAAFPWGAPVENQSVNISGVGIPTNSTLCGKEPIRISMLDPGSFDIEMNSANASFSILQTMTNDFTIDTMSVVGSFIGTSTAPLPGHMMRVGGTDQWESTHQIDATGAVTFRFVANGGMAKWGATNATARPLPATGTLVADSTNLVTVSGLVPGRYRINFNHATGNFAFRQVYANSANVNLLKNSGFEQTTSADGGNAVDWGSWQAWPKRALDGFSPHSGNWVGALHGPIFSEWDDYASFAQDVNVTSGKLYQASAWLRADATWSANSMQIKIEWMNALGNTVGSEAVANISFLTTDWVRYAVEGTAPSNATKAHVVFLCSGAGATGTMQMDDVEMRAISGRTQNFDSWGNLQSFGAFAPDWSVGNGRVVWNVPPGRPAADVFISQYVEGTGNNKAIEIYNGTLGAIALTNYFLQQYDNGALVPSSSIQLSGMLGPGEARVISRPADGLYAAYRPDDEILMIPNLLTNKLVTFNGDDVIVLRQGSASGTIKDRIGQVASNASSTIWARNIKDRTLTRKQNVFTGNVDAVTAAFSMSDWDVSPANTFAGLGGHDISFVDPNEPYTPSGYSLVINSNSWLMSGDLQGGVGDLSFWYRTESASPPVTMDIMTGPTETGPWTTNATLANVAESHFRYFVAALNVAEARYLRIQQRQPGGGTNRFRIDEVSISEMMTTRRTEDFNGWTDASYDAAGNYLRFGWRIQNASISPTNGQASTRAALLADPSGMVISPAFDGGVGEVRFWAKASGTEANLILQSTMDGSNWIEQATYTVRTGMQFSAWLYLPEPSTQVRIMLGDSEGAECYVDNVEIRLPVLARDQDFDGWPTMNSYATNAPNIFMGWSVSNALVDSQNAYEGQVARLINTATPRYVQSPDLAPEGIGLISFRYRKWAAADTTTQIQVQLSTNANNWTTIAIVTNTDAANYQQFSLFLNDTSNRFVRLYVAASGAVRVLIDDIRIGVPQPRPQVIVSATLSPPNPTVTDTMRMTADAITRYGATILSVTGYYRVGTSGAFVATPMPSVGFGEYASTATIPAQAAGTQISTYAQIQYAGVGAASNSSSYTTNLLITAVLTNFVSSVALGNVWVNEIGYECFGLDEPWKVLDHDPWVEYTGESHEFIELCGLAGTDIGGWRIELAFGSDTHIALNGGNPIYATYAIPSNTVLVGQEGGHGFYVLGDIELKAKRTINRELTTLVPASISSGNPWMKDHIFTGTGVIRLVNQYGHRVYSLSYVGYATGSDRIPATQDFQSTNTIGLVGTGAVFTNFNWQAAGLSVGEGNMGQTLKDPTPTSNTYAWAWHTPEQRIVPNNTVEAPPFTMFSLTATNRHSQRAAAFNYGYVNASMASPSGTLIHRLQGTPAWSETAMAIVPFGLDSNGNLFVRATLTAPLPYQRKNTVQYIIHVNPGTTTLSPVWLGGTNGNNISSIYTNRADAENSPFRFTLPITEKIEIDSFAITNNSFVLRTSGNDPQAPITNFWVQFSTNLTAATAWRTTNFTQTASGTSNTFTVTNLPTASPNALYRIVVMPD